jgi:hypothetical protein
MCSRPMTPLPPLGKDEFDIGLGVTIGVLPETFGSTDPAETLRVLAICQVEQKRY